MALAIRSTWFSAPPSPATVCSVSRSQAHAQRTQAQPPQLRRAQRHAPADEDTDAASATSDFLGATASGSCSAMSYRRPFEDRRHPHSSLPRGCPPAPRAPQPPRGAPTSIDDPQPAMADAWVRVHTLAYQKVLAFSDVLPAGSLEPTSRKAMASTRAQAASLRIFATGMPAIADIRVYNDRPVLLRPRLETLRCRVAPLDPST